MAKKPANAKATEDPKPATSIGVAAPVNDAAAEPAAGDQGGIAGGGADDRADPGEGAAAEIVNGTTEVGGSSTSSSGDGAASPEQTNVPAPAGAPIPPFLDAEGKVRKLTAEDVRPILITKNVKVDGVFLEAGVTALVPYDVFVTLAAIDAVEKE